MTVYVRLRDGSEDVFEHTMGEYHENGEVKMARVSPRVETPDDGTLIVLSVFGRDNRIGFYSAGSWISWRSD